MLLRKTTKLVRKKLVINLPSDVAERLDRVTERAVALGYETPLEEAIASYLTRAIGQAEAELKKHEVTNVNPGPRDIQSFCDNGKSEFDGST